MIRIWLSYFITQLIIIANLLNWYFSIKTVFSLHLMKEIDLRKNVTGHEQLMDVHYGLLMDVHIVRTKYSNVIFKSRKE